MLERVRHPIALMRRRVACDSRVSVASDCESARADGAGVFKRRKQVVGFLEVLAHGSGALRWGKGFREEWGGVVGAENARS